MVEEKVREGYKRSGVGVIPEDWEVNKLKNLVTKISSGKSKTSSFQNGNYSIYGSRGEIGRSLNYDYTGRRILVARVGAYAGTIYSVEGKYSVSDNTLMIELQGKSFFYYILEYLKFQKLNKMVFGSGQPLITGTQLKKLNILTPPLKEQKAIAEVLSDTDDLITSLQKLIDKKEKIKKGAMQKLLTGKERLPGFDGEWEEKELGEIIEGIYDYTANGSFAALKENVKYYSKRNYAVLLRTTDLEKKKFEPERFTDKKGYDFLKKTSLYGGEIIIANVGSLGNVYKVPKYNMPMTLAPNTYLINIREKYAKDYIYYMFKTDIFYDKIMTKVGSSAFKSINKDNLRSISMIFSQDIKEQKAIAQILSEMDAEIEALNKKLEKYKKIKQGMMEELLTGRIRLV
ncbi:restriction endonuclease subunit S [Halanaerobium sp.]|uniref:restriction endonuclease subunit S n=1 Tax=Halanaerobium sp. TaxID=1895664 RepID=UPI000DE6B292|nr:restriction endonuclease subunit S [Halanaerobium sp.]PUU90491.1 MAG: type I restriction-modification system specificity subunit [Halanaerobium sp.]